MICTDQVVFRCSSRVR